MQKCMQFQEEAERRKDLKAGSVIPRTDETQWKGQARLSHALVDGTNRMKSRRASHFQKSGLSAGCPSWPTCRVPVFGLKSAILRRRTLHTKHNHADQLPNSHVYDQRPRRRPSGRLKRPQINLYAEPWRIVGYCTDSRSGSEDGVTIYNILWWTCKSHEARTVSVTENLPWHPPFFDITGRLGFVMCADPDEISCRLK